MQSLIHTSPRRSRTLALSTAGLFTGALLFSTAYDRDRASATLDWLADICTSGPLFSTPAGLSQAVGRPGTTVRPLSCEKLPNVPGKSITTVLVTYPPNAFSPAHRHPGSVMAVVVSGHIRSQLNSAPAEVFTAGGTWFEPPGTLHTLAENTSATEPAELIATFVTDNDCGPLVILEPSGAS